jgi:hypothetical protein
MKKPYEKPVIVYTEKITARTTTCISGDEACRVNGGPLQS